MNKKLLSLFVLMACLLGANCVPNDALADGEQTPNESGSVETAPSDSTINAGLGGGINQDGDSAGDYRDYPEPDTPGSSDDKNQTTDQDKDNSSSTSEPPSETNNNQNSTNNNSQASPTPSTNNQNSGPSIAPKPADNAQDNSTNPMPAESTPSAEATEDLENSNTDTGDGNNTTEASDSKSQNDAKNNNQAFLDLAIIFLIVAGSLAVLGGIIAFAANKLAKRKQVDPLDYATNSSKVPNPKTKSQK